jgi:cell filamentation protein, protein adenylyltransferase
MARLLRAIPLPPSDRAILDQINIARAVRGTTGIEGTQLSEAEAAEIVRARDAEPVLPESRERDEQEARNALEAMKFLAETIESGRNTPISEPLICKIHELTTKSVAYPENEPGVYRKHGVVAGSYSAPPYQEVQRLMAEFVQWLNEPPTSAWPPIVRALAAHFYFVSIHPFVDGNGRTGRAIESFVLYQAGLNVLGFYSLANYYYRQRGNYQEALNQARFRSKGNLTEFIKFGARGLVEEINGVHAEALQAGRRYAFREHARRTLRDTSLRTDVRERLLDFLVKIGSETVGEAELYGRRHLLASMYAGKSVRMIRRDVTQLLELELLARDGHNLRANFGLMDQFQPAPAP